jgi:predicted membrane protein
MMVEKGEEKGLTSKSSLVFITACIIGFILLILMIIQTVTHEPSSIVWFILFFGSGGILFIIFRANGLKFWVAGWLIFLGLILVIFAAWYLFLPLLLGISFLYFTIRDMIKSKKQGSQQKEVSKE